MIFITFCMYSEKFKQEAANQVVKNSYPIKKDTAQRLGLHPDSLKA